MWSLDLYNERKNTWEGCGLVNDIRYTRAYAGLSFGLYRMVWLGKAKRTTILIIPDAFPARISAALILDKLNQHD